MSFLFSGSAEFGGLGPPPGGFTAPPGMPVFGAPPGVVVILPGAAGPPAPGGTFN